MYEFGTGKKNIYVVFDEESEFSGPRTPNSSPDKVFEENVPYKNLSFNMLVLLISYFLSVRGVMCGPSKGLMRGTSPTDKQVY